MRKLIIVAVVLLGLTACEKDYERDNRLEVEACFDRGGEARYTVDRYGNIEHFLTCVE